MDPPRARPPPSALPTSFSAAPATASGRAAAAALTALARAARSLVLYDPGNDAVRQFLADYGDKARAALEHGELCVHVQPFEMLVGGEVVYQEKDRERSLAFKLFRDGVRRLTLRAGVPWEELLRLLEVLAVRCTGVRQQEEDVVTLLRKCAFREIDVEAVEGFTPAEENPEPEMDEEVRLARLSQPPLGWDTPMRKLPSPGPLEWSPVPDELLAPLRAEDGDLDDLALSVARDLLAEALRARWPSPNADLAAFFAELRDALLADGRLASLRRLVDLIGEAGAGELRDAMLRGLGDARTLELVLASVPPGARELPRELVPFLPLLGIGPTLDMLAEAQGESRQRLLVGIVMARLPRETAAVLPCLASLPPQVVRELAQTVVARAPERALEVARYLIAQKDDALQLEGLAALEAAPRDVPLRPLCELLRSPSRSVRVRSAEVIGRRGDASALDALRDALESGDDVANEEAEALGRAMAEVAPVAAARLFADWAEPRARFLWGLSARQRMVQWAAVAGMGALPGDADAALQALAERSGGELRRHCLATLARRRKAMTHADT